MVYKSTIRSKYNFKMICLAMNYNYVKKTFIHLSQYLVIFLQFHVELFFQRRTIQSKNGHHHPALLIIINPLCFLMVNTDFGISGKIKVHTIDKQVFILRQFLYRGVKTELNNCFMRILNQLLVRTVLKYVLQLKISLDLKIYSLQ